MGKTFFEFIAGMINGKQNGKTVANQEQTKAPDASGNIDAGQNGAVATQNGQAENCAAAPAAVSLGNDSIDSQAKVIDAVLKTLKKNFAGQKFVFEDKILALWCVDGMVNVLLENTSFKNELAKRLYNEQGVVFREIWAKPLLTEAQQGMLEILNGVYMTVTASANDEFIHQAKVEVIPGCGSTLEQYCLLEAGRTYNIGAGRNVLLDNGAMRRNDIAIDDSTYSPQYEKNKYISRNHAHIVFKEELGFLLYADKGGLRSAGKRTAVGRGEDVVNLEDTAIPFQLKDGDVIILSKAVRLLFTKR